MNLKDEAKGHECTVRIPGVCNMNHETVVLAHYSLPGIFGRGLKAPDLIGAWCCSACHDRVDNRIPSANFTRTEIRLMHAEGVFRSQYQLLKEGKL